LAALADWCGKRLENIGEVLKNSMKSRLPSCFHNTLDDDLYTDGTRIYAKKNNEWMLIIDDEEISALVNAFNLLTYDKMLYKVNNGIFGLG